MLIKLTGGVGTHGANGTAIHAARGIRMLRPFRHAGRAFLGLLALLVASLPVCAGTDTPPDDLIAMSL